MGKPVVGEIVVLPFPQTNLQAGKRRPALVVADLPGDDLVLNRSRCGIRVLSAGNSLHWPHPRKQLHRPDNHHRRLPGLAQGFHLSADFFQLAEQNGSVRIPPGEATTGSVEGWSQNDLGVEAQIETKLVVRENANAASSCPRGPDLSLRADRIGLSAETGP